MLGVLLVDVFRDGVPYLDMTLFDEPAVIRSGDRGRAAGDSRDHLHGHLALALRVPVGVGTAVVLEEFANKPGRARRLIEMNIANLAGVPSIVYGILGLALLVRGFGIGRGPLWARRP